MYRTKTGDLDKQGYINEGLATYLVLFRPCSAAGIKSSLAKTKASKGGIMYVELNRTFGVGRIEL
jgi:hypothetical protein